MKTNNILHPNFNSGRIFISPVLGCNGCCKYCYLELHKYTIPRLNHITIDGIKKFIEKSKEFVQGRNGTIFSVGAWGDIFPKNDNDLLIKSIELICEILKIGNPVQIMSKFSLDDYNIKKICESQMYKDQLLYSTTITTLEKWSLFEPNTSKPIDRLKTCNIFTSNGVPTNVLLKPFLLGLTDIELPTITSLLLDYKISYCVVGILYWNDKIAKKMKDLEQQLKLNCMVHTNNQVFNNLDCNGDIQLNATNVSHLRNYVDFLRAQGVDAFLKSSCVNSNILHVKNPGNYFKSNSHYCIKCGNCSRFQ